MVPPIALGDEFVPAPQQSQIGLQSGEFFTNGSLKRWPILVVSILQLKDGQPMSIIERRAMRRIFQILILLMFAFAGNAYAAPTYYYQFAFGEDDGRPLGDTVTYTDPSAFSISRVRDFNNDGLADLIDFRMNGSAELSWYGTYDVWSTVTFATTKLDNVNLEPGIYENAQRAAFADPGHPGIDYSFDFNGPNEVSGNFKIIESVIKPNSSVDGGFEVSSFAAEYTANSRTGTLYYNYDPEKTVAPEPSTMALFGIGILGAFARKKFKKSV